MSLVVGALATGGQPVLAHAVAVNEPYLHSSKTPPQPFAAHRAELPRPWIPAFAGMTMQGCGNDGNTMAAGGLRRER
ncbi:MAG: hypothetical protein KA375_13260 [Vitreoscilla sp.]|nr:hypothetical protein [Burkholderiales bacterium]MBP6338561.1 hypothetical protein [Vitreoscilla sp.]MBP6674278.1 hypothetical protein [Vitreoscilla sp.]